MLRALTTDHGAAFDADRAFIARAAALQQDNGGGGGGISSGKGGALQAEAPATATAAALQQQILGAKRESPQWQPRVLCQMFSPPFAGTQGAGCFAAPFPWRPSSHSLTQFTPSQRTQHKPSPTAAPKAARDDFEAFLAAARALVGGDPPSGELAEAAAAAWRAIGADCGGPSSGGGGVDGDGAPEAGEARVAAPEGVKLHKPGPLLARQLAPYGAALKAALGHVEGDGAVAGAVTAVSKLRAWRAQLGLRGDGGIGGKGGGSAPKGATAAVAAAGKQQQQQPSLGAEWGADLAFVAPDADARLRGAEAYVAALCGGGIGGGGIGGGGGLVSAAGAGGAAGATPAELLQIYSSAGMGAGAGAADDTAGDAALAAALAAADGGGGGGYEYDDGGAEGAGADERVEIDSDDERRRGRKAGVLWLERWVKGVAGPAPEEVDALGTAVATLLLSDAAAAGAGGSSGEALAAEVMDVVGDDGFEAAQQLMERRCAARAQASAQAGAVGGFGHCLQGEGGGGMEAFF